MSVDVRGFYGNLIVVDGDLTEEFAHEVPASVSTVLSFSNGSEVTVRRDGDAWIMAAVNPDDTAVQIHQEAEEDETTFSDVATIDADIDSVIATQLRLLVNA